MTTHERGNRVRWNRTCTNWIHWKETKITNKNKCSDTCFPAFINRWLKKEKKTVCFQHGLHLDQYTTGSLSHLRNFTPKHLSILPNEVHFKSDLVLKVAGGVTHTQWWQEGAIFAPLEETHCQNYIFLNIFFVPWWLPKILMPSLCTRTFRSPHKNAVKQDIWFN